MNGSFTENGRDSAASSVPSVIYFIIMATVISSVEKNKAVSFIKTQGKVLVFGGCGKHALAFACVYRQGAGQHPLQTFFQQP